MNGTLEKTCNHCGKMIENSAKFCRYCGAKAELGVDSNSDTSNNRNSAEKNSGLEESSIDPVKYILENYNESSKVEAIKKYRELTGEGLKEAKEAVDWIFSPSYEEKEQRKKITKCKACGTEMAFDAKFCTICGEKVGQSQNTSNASEVRKTSVECGDEKYSGKEMVDKIARFITGGLSIISSIMAIGALFGVFDNNPIPFFVLVGVVLFVNWLGEKLPKIPTLFFAIFEIVALIICFNISNDVSAVLSVKGGSPNQYPNITYEQAFDGYFTNSTWEACKKNEEGNEIVKFTGTCTYLGVDAVAEIKFEIYEEQDCFVVSSVKINGEDVGLLGNVLIMDVFEEYQNNH